MSDEMIAGIRKDRLAAFATREAATYAKARPKSAKALAKGAGHFLNGVPMHWMADWPMPHLPLIAKAHGARIEDIDGHGLDDFLPWRYRVHVRPFAPPRWPARSANRRGGA
jgi:glutamate-1-semialdehyde 2,1-aminomutase